MMTRKHLVLSLAALAIVGCQRGWNIPPDQLDPTPIATDSAMEKRQWDQSKATYAWTGVQTYPTLETWKPAENQPFYYQYGEVPMFLGNIVASPYAAYKTPPWRLQEYRGATVERAGQRHGHLGRRRAVRHHGESHHHGRNSPGARQP